MQNKYEVLGVVGEGAYGIVYKCKNKETGTFVAIKKFKEAKDELVKKTMRRELKMLQILKNENIVSFLEAFKRKGNLFLVFEYVDQDLLELLQSRPSGLDPMLIRNLIYQLCKAIKYLHNQNIIHRDIKPENLLIDNNMHLKLCDFGFARKFNINNREALTDYVATRWYRSPELLLTNGYYGPEVDYWAIGCIMGELADGNPLFPGENEVDQLYCIEKVLGNLPQEQINMFYSNPLFNGKSLLNVSRPETLERRYMEKLNKTAISFMKGLLALDPKKRLNGETVFQHPYFAALVKKDKEKEEQQKKLIMNTTNKVKTPQNNVNKNDNNNNNNEANKNVNNIQNSNPPTLINTTNINIINLNNNNNNEIKINNTKNQKENEKIIANKSIQIFPSEIKNNNNNKEINIKNINKKNNNNPFNKTQFNIISFNNTMNQFKSNNNNNNNNYHNNSSEIKEQTQKSNVNKLNKLKINNNNIKNKQQANTSSLGEFQNFYSFKDNMDMYKTFFKNNKNDKYNYNINTNFTNNKYNYDSTRKNYNNNHQKKSPNKNNNIIYEDVEYEKEYKEPNKKKHNNNELNNLFHSKQTYYKKPFKYASTSMYGNFGGYEKKKFQLPSLNLGKKYNY